MLHQLHDLIIYYDYTIWYYMNVVWHNSFLDTVIPYLRNQWFWAPLYLFLLIFMPSNYGKRGWIWCLGYLLAFGMSDQISAHFMKPYFHRIRPCNNPYLVGMVHNIVPCGSGFSFPSSHASNHFSMGIFSAVTLGRAYKWVWPVAIVWAAVVSYSQVYVGVHFPVDVTCGMLIGIGTGTFAGKLFNSKFDLAKVNPS